MVRTTAILQPIIVSRELLAHTPSLQDRLIIEALKNNW